MTRWIHYSANEHQFSANLKSGPAAKTWLGQGADAINS
jgi:hypothetical protein